MFGIIFDCDGTLVDSEAAHYASWRHAMQKRGGDLSVEEYHHLAGLNTGHVSKKLHEKVLWDSPHALCEDKYSYFFDVLKNGLPPIERTVSFVRELGKHKQDLPIKLGVASAAFKEEILIHLENLGILHLFDAVVSGADDLSGYSDPEGVNKPKPYVYLHAAKLLGIEPGRCAAFEDTHAGLKAAKTAGLVTFAVPNSYTKHQDFSEAHYLIPSEEQLEIESFFKRFHSKRS